MFRKPALHLLHGVWILKTGQVLQLRHKRCLCKRIYANCLFHQRHIYQDAAIVDLLAEMIFIPDSLRHREAGQLLLYRHFDFDVTFVVLLEHFPFIRRIRRIMTYTVFIRNTEIADQRLAFIHLLRIQMQRSTDIPE